MPKPLVHHGETPLHRAFSAYLFDDAGRLLVTRRARSKQTFPGMWTNTVCGHPGPGEDDADAIARRARYELGVEVAELRPALPGYRYRAEFRGVVENEICPVYLGRFHGDARAGRHRGGGVGAPGLAGVPRAPGGRGRRRLVPVVPRAGAADRGRGLGPRGLIDDQLADASSAVRAGLEAGRHRRAEGRPRRRRHMTALTASASIGRENR